MKKLAILLALCATCYGQYTPRETDEVPSLLELTATRVAILPTLSGFGRFMAADQQQATLNGQTYHTFSVGYNVTGAAGAPLLSGEPSMAWQYETNYYDGVKNTMELYSQFHPAQTPSAANAYSREIRPIAIQVNRATNLVTQMNLSPTGGAMYMNGDVRSRGQFIVEAISAPAAPTVTATGTTGSTSYSYRIVAKISTRTVPSVAAATIANGNATLSGTNYNAITWPIVDGATGYDIYRTASSGTPATTGKIGSTVGSHHFNDTGLAGDSAAVPANTSGFVGINNTSPNLPLTVGGAASFTGTLFVTSSIVNGSDSGNASLSLATAGSTISRNIADANDALIVNLAHVSSTGDVVEFRKAGTMVAKVDGTGAVTSLYQRFGSGSPEGVVSAPVGAVYHRTDGGAGTSVYHKEGGSTGSTGWAAK